MAIRGPLVGQLWPLVEIENFQGDVIKLVT